MSYIKADNAREQEYFDFLEELRQSGDTNMFGASIYLQSAFPSLNKKESGDVLCKWMKLHSDESRILERPTSKETVSVKFQTKPIIRRRERNA